MTRRTGRPSQVGTWTPLVIASIGCPASSCHVCVAVSPCSCDTAFALLAWRRTKAVMSNGAFGSSVGPRPSSSSSVGSMRAAASHDWSAGVTSSRAKTSFPAGTGVWIVKTASRPTRRSASAAARAGSRGHHLARALDEQERRVALVQVPDGGLDAERSQRAHAADPEHELLAEAHLAAAHVEDVGDRPIGLVVGRDVGVEQQDRHAADLRHPDRRVHRAIGHLDA